MTSTVPSNLLKLILFADVTNVFMSHKDLNYLSDMSNLEMDKLSIWFKVNKNALTAALAVSLAWRLDREMRRWLVLHETGSPKIFYFLLYQRRYFSLVCELIKYTLAMTRNTSAVAGYTCVYLTIIPQARMGSESIALRGRWAHGLLTQRPWGREEE